MLAFMGVEYTHFAYTSKDFLRFYVAAANPVIRENSDIKACFKRMAEEALTYVS